MFFEKENEKFQYTKLWKQGVHFFEVQELKEMLVCLYVIRADEDKAVLYRVK